MILPSWKSSKIAGCLDFSKITATVDIMSYLRHNCLKNDFRKSKPPQKGHLQSIGKCKSSVQFHIAYLASDIQRRQPLTNIFQQCMSKDLKDHFVRK